MCYVISIKISQKNTGCQEYNYSAVGNHLKKFLQASLEKVVSYLLTHQNLLSGTAVWQLNNLNSSIDTSRTHSWHSLSKQ